MEFQITPIFVALFILLNIVFLLPIGPYRLKTGIPFWGGEEKLDRLVRGHGNFIEFAPLFLIALATAEYLGTAPLVLAVAGAMMTVGRLVHYIGMIKLDNPLNNARLTGTLLSLISLSALGLCIAWKLVTSTTT